MAVQAQYPSNVLYSIGNDYSLQPQPGGGGGGGGGFNDQSTILFNNGGTNYRKRGREIVAMNPFSMQLPESSTQQLIELNQLHTNQPNVVSTGLNLRLAFGDQHQQQQQLQHQHRQQTLSPQSSSVVSSLLSQDMETQIRNQRNEIEHFIQTQGEQMRRTLAEKRQRHYGALLSAAEESLARRLREKEAEVGRAARRNAELEARVAQLSADARVWEAKARAEAAAAAALEAQLQQAMIMSGGGCGGQEGIGCSGGVEGQGAEDAESGYVDPDRVVEWAGPSCKACRKRVASVVVLPCRHLCLCTECDAVIQTCPRCLSFRNSSVQVFLS
ncbi:BOI-related E3 ubiquitin-protein ligase 1-like [Cornus florida]|uniref:BOI-related E3 ubiquitin-protein ligase 1-like n=1 Tax=Cornus florida TaxID=4283 RepID=UPI00289D4D47|nr:BOI-related E3 ubiquitin-protein ligase 1-like [Cornus florida]